MKKKLLFTVLLLALALTCLFTLTAGADAAEPALSIDYANLSFSDAVYLKYAVAAEGVNTSDVRLLVWREPDTNGYAAGTEDEVILPAYLDTIGGKQYIIFDYKNLSAKEMGDDVYVRAAVTVDGKTTVSPLNKFSVLQYANAVLGGNYSTSLKTLLTDMLSYGASAQAHFNYKTDRPVDGTWYTVTVTDGALSDGFTTGLYMAGDTLTLTPAPAPEGKIFSHWVNSAGEEQTLPITVPAQNETYTAVYVDAPKLAYMVNADGTTCTITGLGTITDTDIVIPEKIDGYTVTAIGERAFYGCKNLTSVTIGGGVTTIGTYAFGGTGITSVTIGSNVTSIGNSAFESCKNLTAITIPNSVKSIGNHAFNSCTALASVTFGNGVTTIGDSAFYGCAGLSSITIPYGVTIIDDFAFASCQGLTSVTIPDSVTSIGEYAFAWSENLTNIKFEGTVAQWSAISKGSYWDSGIPATAVACDDGAGCFTCVVVVDAAVAPTCSQTGLTEGKHCSACGVVLTAQEVVPATGNHSYGDWVTTKQPTTTEEGIKERACSCGATETQTIEKLIPKLAYAVNADGTTCTITGLGNVTDTNLVIPEEIDGYTVTAIGEGAFDGSLSLTSVTIGDSVTSIGEWAFSSCNISRVTIGNSVTSIGEWAFFGCSRLSSITIPDSVTSIGSYAFSGCASLTSVTIGNGVTSIGECAFGTCTYLRSVTIGDSVTSIGYDAFEGCTSLSSIQFKGTATQWNAITKGSNWDSHVPATQVVCKDGSMPI